MYILSKHEIRDIGAILTSNRTNLSLNFCCHAYSFYPHHHIGLFNPIVHKLLSKTRKTTTNLYFYLILVRGGPSHRLSSDLTI